MGTGAKQQNRCRDRKKDNRQGQSRGQDKEDKLPGPKRQNNGATEGGVMLEKSIGIEKEKKALSTNQEKGTVS